MIDKSILKKWYGEYEKAPYMFDNAHRKVFRMFPQGKMVEVNIEGVPLFSHLASCCSEISEREALSLARHGEKRKKRF